MLNKLLMFFVYLSTCQTFVSASNPTTAVGLNGKSTIPANLSVSLELNNTAATLAKQKSTESIQPPKLIFGNSASGTIEVCLLSDPETCDSLIEEEGASVNAIAVIGEHIYAGLESGVILRCPMQEKNSCFKVMRLNSAIKSIAVDYGFIYAGLKEGTLRKCRIDKEDSCLEFKKERASVNAIAVKDYDYVYGGWGSQLLECVQGRRKTLSCKPYYYVKSPITALAAFGDEFLFVGLQSGALLRCPLSNDGGSCFPIHRENAGICSLYIFNSHLYVGLSSGGMLRCPVGNKATCEHTLTKKQGKYSFAITYSTMPLYELVRGEHESCSWQPKFQCPPYVIYYEHTQRAGFELNVKNGLLYHSSGEPYDSTLFFFTVVSIYVMEPGGRIYASNNNRNFLLHHSSLAGGQPVAAAGEIEVVNGVIMRIYNFSGHYRLPTVVNNQILDSLKTKGYTKEIEVMSCDKVRLNASLYLRKIARPVPKGMSVFCNDEVMDTSAGIWADA